MVLIPRILIVASSPGLAALEIKTPATRPCKAWFILVTGFSSSTFALTLDTVTGNLDSEVLIGASISVKGTTMGTVTDIDGKYSLSVPSDAILVFSYLGYETEEVAVRNRSLINVSLKTSSQDLEEVVVVGTILKKSDLTGAVSSVSAKVLEEKPVTSINQITEY